MASNVGSLNVDLTLQSAQFINGLKQASAATTKAASSISSAMNLAKVGIAGFIGAFSVDMLTSQIQQAFDYGDAIVDLADRTGATTKTIQEFRYAAQLSGSSVESADAAVEKFAKNLGAAQNGNKAMAKSFADLGVTSSDTDTALRQTMDGISKLGTVTQRNQKTIELFGKSAGDLTLLLGDGTSGFDALAAAAQQYGIVLDDHVLRNGGKVNDQLDTMKMILNAQMANMIIQNADALMQLANGFMTAAAAAVHFFSAMQVNKDMSLQSANPWDWDVPSIVGGRLQGKSNDDIRNEARDRLKSTADGRRALYKSVAEEYNSRKAKGEDPNSVYMQALRAEGQQMVAAHRAANVSLRPPGANDNGTLPKPTGSAKHTPTSRPLKSDEELEREWMRAFIDARGDLYSAQSNLSNDPTERAELDANSLRNRYLNNISRIDSDVGTDKEIREGKKRYSEAQAEQLKEIEKEIFDAQYDRVIRDRDEEIAKDRLAISEAGLRNDADLMSAEMSLARSSRERRDLSLKMVENQFALEKLQLEAIIASKTATDAEKKIAEERLKMLPVLKGAAQEQAKRQTQSPLEQYLDAIPKTRDEMNDALESVEVEGLKSLEDGLMGVIKGTKSVGEAFSDMAETIIDGLLKIALEQAIIKPLGNLLFGGSDSDSGGGILGSLAKGVISGLTGKRANGGYSGAGDYLVGERGPEIVRFGSNANVTPTRALKNAANDNRGGVTVRIDSIVSNDPDAIRRATVEGVMAAMPTITKQATDTTIARLQRRGL